MAMRKDARPPFAGLNGRSPEELFAGLPTPCYILDEAALRRNGEILAGVSRRTGCRILLAQKAFSNYNLYPVLAPWLAGTEASGLYEARLGAEEMPGKEVHVFCGAYREEEFEELLRYAGHIVFNSPRQLEKFGPAAKQAGKSVGIRINPEHSTQSGHGIYDPCAPGSRLGVTRVQWERTMTPELISLLDGLHFHTLCEQDADALESTLHAVELKFGDVLPRMKWLNFGGGHHITRPGYEVDRLERCIRKAQETWGVTVYLEPGEACALNAGYLACRVLDVLQNGEFRLAILDTSAACHMPDVLEMPYRPPLYGAGNPGEKKRTFRLGGPTCLAGDVIGDYSFDGSLREGELLLFGDMAIYTTCKNNTFNGMPLPGIFVLQEGGKLKCLRKFGYTDFKSRLGGLSGLEG
ncbi:carboxynorspermidine decarboxylase [Candidatus Bariatricus faecipullorum]